MLYHIEHGFEKHVAEIWVKFFSRSKNKFHTSYKKDMLPSAPIPFSKFFILCVMCACIMDTIVRGSIAVSDNPCYVPVNGFLNFIMKMIDLLKVGFAIATIY